MNLDKLKSAMESMSTNGLCMVGFPEEENGFWFVVQSLSPVWLFVTPWTAALQTSPSFTVPQSLLRLMSIELMMSSNCHPVIPFSFCPQSFLALGSFPMSQLFASGGQSIGASVSASVLPMNIQGWFPFRIDWFDHLPVQGTLKTTVMYVKIVQQL